MEEKSATSTTCTLVVVKDEILSFSQTDKFRKAVRTAVNDEMFWRDIINRLCIGTTVQSELDSRVPPLVQNEARRVVNDMVTDKLNNYTKFQIPAHVAKELLTQITNFLANHIEMNKILTSHSETMKQELLKVATDTLNKLVNESEYQVVTNAHLQAVDQKCDGILSKVHTACNQQLTTNSQAFTSQLTLMQQANNVEVDKLKDKTNQVDRLTGKLTNLEREISSLRWLFGSATTVLSIVVLGLFYMKR